MYRSSLQERLRLLTKELKANPEYQKDLQKLQKRLKSENLDIEQFAGKGYVKAFVAKNDFFLKWELKDWICGEPVLYGLEVESDFVRNGRLLYIPSWVNRGDVRNYIPRLAKIIKAKKLEWGSSKNNTPLLRFKRNKEIRKQFKALRKKRISSANAIDLIATKSNCSYDTIRQIVYNPKFDS